MALGVVTKKAGRANPVFFKMAKVNPVTQKTGSGYILKAALLDWLDMIGAMSVSCTDSWVPRRVK
jgi:hypothetical protein